MARFHHDQKYDTTSVLHKPKSNPYWWGSLPFTNEIPFALAISSAWEAGPYPCASAERQDRAVGPSGAQAGCTITFFRPPDIG
jgi:hypothetical protein